MPDRWQIVHRRKHFASVGSRGHQHDRRLRSVGSLGHKRFPRRISLHDDPLHEWLNVTARTSPIRDLSQLSFATSRPKTEIRSAGNSIERRGKPFNRESDNKALIRPAHDIQKTGGVTTADLGNSLIHLWPTQMS